MKAFISILSAIAICIWLGSFMATGETDLSPASPGAGNELIRLKQQENAKIKREFTACEKRIITELSSYTEIKKRARSAYIGGQMEDFYIHRQLAREKQRNIKKLLLQSFDLLQDYDGGFALEKRLAKIVGDTASAINSQWLEG